MWRDPIVNEARKAGEQLAREGNYDLHLFFKNMRKREKNRKAKAVPKTKYGSSLKSENVVQEK